MFRGAQASGVWFLASRRKPRSTNFSPPGIPERACDESSGGTPELARGTRALPIPTPNHPEVAAFTLVELLVVLAVLLLGAMLLAPALARTQVDSRSIRCLNNHRQLCRAWLMYASDNNDKLATSMSGAATPSIPNWATGWLDWGPSSANTNTVYLTDPRYSILATYCGKDARLFKCPADQYVSTVQRSLGWRERVRSVSQNIYAANSNIASGPTDPAFAPTTKLTGLLNPKPAETWVSIDENADSINDGVFFAPRTTSWVDLPANYHDGGASVAFADGHVELHRWQRSVLNVSIRTSSFFLPPVLPNDPDILWVRYHTPRQPGAN
jgi:prepilin-type processing-associated H-X9-DG protein